MKSPLIAVALLVQSLFSHSAAGQAGLVQVSSLEESVSKGTVGVPVRNAGDDRRLVAEAEVDGTKVCMVVDSGADTIIVDETAAKDKKLELRKIGTASGATGKAETLMRRRSGSSRSGRRSSRTRACIFRIFRASRHSLRTACLGASLASVS